MLCIHDLLPWFFSGAGQYRERVVDIVGDWDETKAVQGVIVFDRVPSGTEVSIEQ